MKFLTNQPAFLLEKTLVIADIHVGIEYEYFRSGIKVPSQTDKILERVKKLIKETNAKKLLILGDLKHKVPGTSYQEKREVPEFLNELDDLVEIEIVAGNHDGGLKSMLSNDIKLHPSKGFLSGNVYFCHGNSWPSKEFLKADYIIMGHIHPLFEIKDKLGYRWSERVWVRAELGKKKIEEKYGKSKK
ncbi:MAG: metallophosphoesterase, partial [Candidatus Aenigmarchaeota archaeon]|nr:metallophosphoesterase [Candidatus Aenigmarchaeota archaeon]